VAESPSLSFGARFVLAWTCFFKLLADGVFAARVAGLSGPELPPAPKPEAEPKVVEKVVEKTVERVVEKATPGAALQLLGLLQREGRLVDFIEQDIVSFSDADVGIAARVVHEGCRKALRGHVELEAIRREEEGVKLVVETLDGGAVKLTGNVQGAAPFKGTLRHKGWRAKKITLPEIVQGHDPSVLAPAEVEL
jgi:hypothetical protein